MLSGIGCGDLIVPSPASLRAAAPSRPAASGGRGRGCDGGRGARTPRKVLLAREDPAAQGRLRSPATAPPAPARLCMPPAAQRPRDDQHGVRCRAHPARMADAVALAARGRWRHLRRLGRNLTRLPQCALRQTCWGVGSPLTWVTLVGALAPTVAERWERAPLAHASGCRFVPSPAARPRSRREWAQTCLPLAGSAPTSMRRAIGDTLDDGGHSAPATPPARQATRSPREDRRGASRSGGER